MWTRSPASFEGKHYRIEAAECQPRPDPPPLLIGGGGEQRTLRVVARYADLWAAPVQSIEEFAHKQRVLAERCREIGRDPAEITHTFAARVNLVDDPARLEQRPGRYTLAGTPDVVTRDLERLVGLGVKHFQLSFYEFPGLDDLHLFVDKVVPRLVG